jgi:hypothetical protein
VETTLVHIITPSLPSKKPTRQTAPLSMRNPRSTFYRLNMAAPTEEKSVTDLVIELIEHKIRGLVMKKISCRRRNKDVEAI